MFQLSCEPLETLNLKSDFSAGQAGAFASFEGWVRNHNDGRSVFSLQYEAMPELCRSEAQRILDEASQRFNVLQVSCIHRVGTLKIGEMAVWVGVVAAHRDDAFNACRYIIDEIKKRLPIWKKEFYADGESGWVNAQDVPPQPANENTTSHPLHAEYYSRQIVLPEIGIKGQQKLAASRALVIGAGGLGSAALTSLAQAGVGLVGIVEFDVVQISNLHRQALYTPADTGQLKSDIAVNRLKAINPQITLASYPARLDPLNIEAIIAPYDVVLDCTDNFAAKFLINDACILQRKRLVQAGIYQWEGQLRVYDPGVPSACLRCLWPQIPPTDCVDDCGRAGVLGAVANILGHWQAVETIKSLLGLPVLSTETLILDLKSNSFNRVKQAPSPDCQVCGLHPVINRIDPTAYEFRTDPPEYELDLAEISVEKINQYQWVDIRESAEILADPLTNLKTNNFSFSRFGKETVPINTTDAYLVFCAQGSRSRRLVQKLRAEGYTNVWSVHNGVPAVKKYLSDPPGKK